VSDPVLAIDAGQVDLDRFHAHEELCGDLSVRASGGDELGHPALGRSEGTRRAPPQTDSVKLLLSARDPEPCPELLEQLERLPQPNA
jgi:hypothetical protein